MDRIYPRALKADEIRLIEVHPLSAPTTSEEPPLALTLHTFRNSKAPAYTALSYTWGNPEDAAAVSVHGVGLYVTQNFYCALAQFRLDISTNVPCNGHDPHADGGDSWPSRYIWADALSINQADEHEKSSQVALMSSIFSRAACVMAFLGDDDHGENSEIAFAKIHNVMDRYYATVPNASLASVIPPWAGQMFAEEFVVCGDVNGDTIWTAVQNFYSRSWWSRLWVLSEATTSRPTWVVCSGVKTSLQDVLLFAMLMAMAPLYPHESAFALYPFSSFVYGLKDLLDQRLGGSAEDVEPGLLNILSACRHFESADPRDKVYGALGFVSGRQAKGLVVDYGKDIIEVYTDVVRSHVRTSNYSNKLDFLAADGLPEGGMTGLPSWLPDWRHQDQFQVSFRKHFTDLARTPRADKHTSHDSIRPAYRASGSEHDLSVLGITPKQLVTIADRTLHVKGYRVGYLYDMQAALQPNDGPAEQQAVLAQWHDSIVVGADYFTGESEMEAFSQVIAAGLAFDGHEAMCRTPAIEAPKEMRHVFRAPSGEGVRIACSGRKLARVVQKDWTSHGLALVPECAREGDQVFVLLGGQVLYILRPTTGGFKFLGEAYVHGLMDGEALDILKQGLESVQEIVIR